MSQVEIPKNPEDTKLNTVNNQNEVKKSIALNELNRYYL